MPLNTLMLIYSFILTIISIFLFCQKTSYKKKYLKLLIDPNELQRVQLFFETIKSPLKEIYKLLKPLNFKRGRKPTNYCFQFRWLLWWKFFGPRKLSRAIDIFNENDTLRKILCAPDKLHSREIFHGFRKKLNEGKLEQIQAVLLKKINNLHKLNFDTLVFDTFPINSPLNNSKCAKSPKRNFNDIKTFIDNLNLSPILNKLEISVKKRTNFETKFIALLVKTIWDFASWDQCHKDIYGKEALKANINLPKVYKSSNSLRDIEKFLKGCKKRLEIEKELLALASSVLRNCNIGKKNVKPRNIEELVLFIHKPHRFKDPGISLSYCAAKNNYFFGRGGIVAAINDLELPIMVSLTSKYKQSEESILEFLKKLNNNFGMMLKDTKVVADSEFGTKNIIQELKKLTTNEILIPRYRTNKKPNKNPKLFKKLRVLIERVIGRQHVQWHLEKPRHIGAVFSNFHIQSCIICDYLQVLFNLKNGSRDHPHALRTIIG